MHEVLSPVLYLQVHTKISDVLYGADVEHCTIISNDISKGALLPE